MEHNTMPKELLNDVAWSFAQKRFGSLPEFAEALAEYNAEIFEKTIYRCLDEQVAISGKQNINSVRILGR